MPGCWAAAILLWPLDGEQPRQEERPSGFRNSLVCPPGDSDPAYSSEGLARNSGHHDGQEGPQASFRVTPVLYSSPVWLLSQADQGPMKQREWQCLHPTELLMCARLGARHQREADPCAEGHQGWLAEGQVAGAVTHQCVLSIW